MQLLLLLDANLSWRSSLVLKNHYDDCIHVDETEMKIPAKDIEIWNYAVKHRMMIVTNDEDFLHLSLLKGFPPKVILLKTGNQNRKYIEKILINAKEQIIKFVASSEYGILELI